MEKRFVHRLLSEICWIKLITEFTCFRHTAMILWTRFNSPSTFVFVRTMPFGYVKVNVNGGELHVVVIFESVGSVARITRKIDSVSLGTWCYVERFVISIPWVVLQILNDNSKLRAIVACQMVENFVSNPQLAVRIAKPIGVLFPRAIEIDRAVFALLYNCPGTHTLRHYRSTLIRRRNHV